MRRTNPITAGSTLMRMAIGIVLGCLTGSSAAMAQTPVLLADINAEPANGVPINGTFLPVGNRIVFGGQRPDVGQELFVCDADGAGVSLLRDIWPGRGGSFPQSAGRLGDRTLFWAVDPDHGRELWSTDGTQAGTVLVRDIRPGPEGSPFNTAVMGVLDGRALFFANDGMHGVELWETDGTEAGTRLAVEFTPGPAGTETSSFPIAIGDGCYFNVSLPGTGYSIVRTDGTVANTVVLAPGKVAREFRPFGELVAFTVGNALWQTDGTAAGTRAVAGAIADVQVTLESAAQLGSGFYARALDESSGVWRGLRLDRSTGEVTFLAVDSPVYYELGDRLMVSGSTAAGADTSVLSADGIFPLSNAETGPLVGVTDATMLAGRVFFIANSRVHFTDGTAAGTHRLWDSARPTLSTGEGVAQGLRVAGGRLFYRASEAAGDPVRAIWSSDGTVDGTFVVGRVMGNTVGSDSRPVGEAGGRLYAMAFKPAPVLWSTDGTASGTTVARALATEVRQNAGSQHAIRGAAAAGGRIVFLAADLSDQLRLWSSDGTADGTVTLTAESFGRFGNTSPYSEPAIVSTGARVVVFNNRRVLQSATDVWTTDGTVTGTRLIETLVVGRDTGVHHVAALDGRAVFVNPSGWMGRAFWATDGTAEGTYALWNTIVSGELDRYTPIATERGRVYGLTGSGTVWATDGTLDGTRSIGGGDFGVVSAASELLAVSTGVFFVIGRSSPGAPDSVFRVNTLTAETTAVWSRPPDQPSSLSTTPSNLIMSGPWVYFSVFGDLWRVDPLEGRAVRIATDAFDPRAVAGGVVYRGYSAGQTEAFVTTGSAAGTVQLTTLSRGYNNSGGMVAWATAFRNGVVLSADDGLLGTEPWFVDLGMLPDCNGNGVRDPEECLAGAAFDANGDLAPDECECLADWNADGEASLDDLFAFLDQWFTGDADLDHSGATDVDDVLGFVGVWLSGCS